MTSLARQLNVGQLTGEKFEGKFDLIIAPCWSVHGTLCDGTGGLPRYSTIVEGLTLLASLWFELSNEKPLGVCSWPHDQLQVRSFTESESARTYFSAPDFCGISDPTDVIDFLCQKLCVQEKHYVVFLPVPAAAMAEVEDIVRVIERWQADPRLHVGSNTWSYRVKFLLMGYGSTTNSSLQSFSDYFEALSSHHLLMLQTIDTRFLTRETISVVVETLGNLSDVVWETGR